MAERLAEGDPTVWAVGEVPELADRLGWLRLHDSMRPRLGEITELAEQASDGVDHVVLLGMGGSSLAPEVFAAVLGPVPGWPRLIVLDSTHPGAVQGVTERIDPARTLFVVSSKSGTTLETLSFFRHFFALTGGDASRFVAVTDPGSSLEQLGRQRGFRAVVTAPPDVGGRYSALTPFGLLPAALVGIDPALLLDAASELAKESTAAAIQLGLVWGVLAASGRDKLTLVTSPSLQAFPAWLEQLVAESLGKDGTGIVPVAGEPLGEAPVYGDDRVFLGWQLAGESVPGLERLTAAGHPAGVLELEQPGQLAGEMLRTELATAAAGEVLGVHPFDQPDVEAAKQLARRAMAGELDAGAIPAVGVGDHQALDRLLSTVGPGDYVAIQAYLPPGPQLDAALTRLRTAVRARTQAATTVGYGPRFLHSTGQLHKGGPSGCVAVQLVDHPHRDVPIPETGDTFGRLIAAQAAGDYQALADRGRRLLRVELGEDPAGEVEALAEGLT